MDIACGIDTWNQRGLVHERNDKCESPGEPSLVGAIAIRSDSDPHRAAMARRSTRPLAAPHAGRITGYGAAEQPTGSNAECEQAGCHTRCVGNTLCCGHDVEKVLV